MWRRRLRRVAPSGFGRDYCDVTLRSTPVRARETAGRSTGPTAVRNAGFVPAGARPAIPGRRAAKPRFKDGFPSYPPGE